MSEKLRNIALIAHGGAGKTSLAEAMLFNAGVTNRLGRTEDGNTVMDYEPEELKRLTSISTSFAQAPWKKQPVPRPAIFLARPSGQLQEPLGFISIQV